MKTLTLKTSKRLNELGLLDNIETEYGCLEGGEITKNNDLSKIDISEGTTHKTLSLEEVIDFLPEKIVEDKKDFCFMIQKIDGEYNVGYINLPTITLLKVCNNIVLLEAIEELINYLLDNDLLKG